MLITIVTIEPFPIGTAGTNHIISLATGFVEEGSQVKVILLQPSEFADRIVNTEAKGTYCGIEFEYS